MVEVLICKGGEDLGGHIKFLRYQHVNKSGVDARGNALSDLIRK